MLIRPAWMPGPSTRSLRSGLLRFAAMADLPPYYYTIFALYSPRRFGPRSRLLLDRLSIASLACKAHKDFTSPVKSFSRLGRELGGTGLGAAHGAPLSMWKLVDDAVAGSGLSSL